MNIQKYLPTSGWWAGCILGSIFISFGCWYAGLDSHQTLGAVFVAAGVATWARSDDMKEGE